MFRTMFSILIIFGIAAVSAPGAWAQVTCPAIEDTRALASHSGLPPQQAELLVHDVLNVFMCTGFTRNTQQYFMKASPVQPGDYLEFFAEIDLLGALSTCPGGDCGSSHSSEAAQCHPLKVEIFRPVNGPPANWQSPAPSAYSRDHGIAGD